MVRRNPKQEYHGFRPDLHKKFVSHTYVDFADNLLTGLLDDLSIRHDGKLPPREGRGKEKAWRNEAARWSATLSAMMFAGGLQQRNLLHSALRASTLQAIPEAWYKAVRPRIEDSLARLRARFTQLAEIYPPTDNGHYELPGYVDLWRIILNLIETALAVRGYGKDLKYDHSPLSLH